MTNQPRRNIVRYRPKRVLKEENAPTHWEGAIILGRGAQLTSGIPPQTFVFGYHIDDEFPTVEVGSKIVSTIYERESPDAFKEFATQTFCASIAALRDGDWLILAQTVSDWTATAEVLADYSLSQKLLTARRRKGEISNPSS